MDRTTRSTCPYCGVGCGVLIDTTDTAEGPQITGVRGDPDHPANAGRLCTKGATLHLTATPMVRQQQRQLQPAWRPARGAALQAITWDAVEQQLAERLLAVRAEHGPDAIGFYISGQLLTEDYHAFNKLARGLVGTNHIDSNSRLCMSAAVVGYKQTLGADAPPTCYEDLNLASCLFLAGTNTAWAHPVLFRRIEAARAARPDLKIIVVDPRRTETAEFADLHLPLRPGTDVALFQGMLHACIWEDWVDRAFIEQHTEGFEALKALVRTMTPGEAARLTGLKEAQVMQAAQWFAQSPASLSLYCMGLNQSSSGTAKNTALIHLHLATGQIGRPGAGPFSLTGQPNAMGGRETGGMATLLPGHRDPMRAQDREEIAALWGCDPLPDRPGRTAVEMFEAAARGEIKALWIACTNPAQSLPDQALVRAALSRCELVILQEAFVGTATADFADVLLPAATWAEKDGTVTNSERRISRVRAALAPAGESKPDWQIVRDVAVRMEAVLRPDAASLFAWERPQQLWDEHRAATRGRDLDITGLSYEQLEAAPQQWPFPEGAQQGRARLYEDRRFAHADGRARFVARPFVPPAERQDASYPLALSTGRLRDQWHGMSRSGTVPRLFAHAPSPALHLHPTDIARRRLQEGALVRVASRRGAMVVPLRADDALSPQSAWLPMHWGSEFVGGQGQLGVNAVTQPVFCPDARQPELKFAAVSVTAVDLRWRLMGAAWVPAGEGAALRSQLRALMGEAAYASCLPAPAALSTGEPAMADNHVHRPVSPSGPMEGWSIEMAFAERPSDAVVQALASALGLTGIGVLRYADSRRGRSRLLRLSGEGAQATLQAVLRVGEGQEAQWLDALWRDRTPVAPFSRRLLAPDAEVSTASLSPQVCNCFNVREDDIKACLSRQTAAAPAERLAHLQATLRCGTSCGSCLPTLRRWAHTIEEIT
ncbi:nitrate reductase [Roseateles terrae]|uniref:Assimilatory nitrate reductase catalytic subunit n=1 Tax=Roseateles terrae TaxID=431060 RepID=A0ABR6GYN5_9BURK|nr:nitrate reductase [Roseateles terrae]MBB3197225.1 assimilatory nitrate reductase catalytic subunit [Roseateles terrae]OWQ83709.1 nitrate reductase [Roseateles terrae]